MADDLNGIFTAIGELKAQSSERRDQVSSLFEITRSMSERMVTVADVAELKATLGNHARRDEENMAAIENAIANLSSRLVGEDGESGILPRLHALEAERDRIRNIVWKVGGAAVGLPTFIVSVVELWRYLRGGWQ